MKNKSASSRASIGKIARLPADIREEINLRLHNGQSGPQILTWLNDLPVVKEILAAQFGGAPLSARNLTNWRATGFQRWLAEQNHIGVMKNTAKYAASLAEAAGGNLCRGVAAFASGKILEVLQKTPDENTDPEELIKLATTAANLQKGEQNNVRLTIAQERLRQRERRLILIRDKQQRDVVAIALRVLGDARAKEIEAAQINNAEKIELLGLQIFGDLWEPRPIPNATTS
jgi:hypothetical protein